MTYSYDASGSFLSKSDFAASYSYSSSRPHVITSAGNATYSHDQIGNVTGRDGDSIDYNAFNKPSHIANASTDTYFTYGADLMRYKQITSQGSTILYIDKFMEIESSGSAVDFRHYLGDVAILTKTGDLGDPTPGIRYTFRDRLGGISMMGDETGLVTELRGYDAFGKPRASNWANKTPATINSSVTDRGFTDHEHLDDWQLIHMNGRGYDYNLGRFLSIDPLIQDPGNSQSINAYTYIMNNPLSGTDPSGYCGTASRIDGGGGASPCTTIIKNGPEESAGGKSESISRTLNDGTILTTTVTPTDSGAEVTIQATGNNGKQILDQKTTLSPDEIVVLANQARPRPESTEFDKAVNRIERKIYTTNPDKPVKVSEEEFGDIRTFEAREIEHLFDKPLPDLSKDEFESALQDKGDSQFFEWHSILFEIEGYSEVFIGADINYYYQGFLTAAAKRSKFMMNRYIEAYNLKQAIFDRQSFYDVYQISPAKEWAKDGYSFYNNTVEDEK